MYTLVIDADEYADNPAEAAGWKLVSFNVDHKSYDGPSKYDDFGMRSKIRNNHAFLLDYHESNTSTWSLSDEKPSKDRDINSFGGILLWSGKPHQLSRPYKNLDERKAFVRDVLREYTAWCNGSVYRWHLEDEEGELIEDKRGEGYYDDTEGLFIDIRKSLKELKLNKVRVTGDCLWLLQFNDLHEPGETPLSIQRKEREEPSEIINL